MNLPRHRVTPGADSPMACRAFIHMSVKNYILTHPLFLSPTPPVVPSPKWSLLGPGAGGAVCVCAVTIIPSTEGSKAQGALLPPPPP